MILRFILLILLLSFNSSFAQNVLLTDSLDIEQICISADEQKMYDILMAYRKKRKLPPIPLSRSLTYVAKMHAMDLHFNRPFNNRKCNMHSWSKYGNWSACCYTDDHKRSEYMWNKPSELTSYKSEGYEIAYGYSNREQYLEHGLITPAKAIEGWKSSQGHNYMMINRGEWKDVDWNAVGVAIYKDFAIIWFGENTDIATEIEICQ